MRRNPQEMHPCSWPSLHLLIQSHGVAAVTPQSMGKPPEGALSELESCRSSCSLFLTLELILHLPSCLRPSFQVPDQQGGLPLLGNGTRGLCPARGGVALSPCPSATAWLGGTSSQASPQPSLAAAAGSASEGFSHPLSPSS